MIHCRYLNSKLVLPQKQTSNSGFYELLSTFLQLYVVSKKTEITINKIIISMIVWSQLKMTNEKKTLIKYQRFLY